MKALTIQKTTVAKLNNSTSNNQGRTISWGTRMGRTISWGTRV